LIEARGRDFATRNFVAEAACLPSGKLDLGFALRRDFGKRPSCRHVGSLYRRPGISAARRRRFPPVGAGAWKCRLLPLLFRTQILRMTAANVCLSTPGNRPRTGEYRHRPRTGGPGRTARPCVHKRVPGEEVGPSSLRPLIHSTLGFRVSVGGRGSRFCWLL
jgi:hypothetical protein